MHLTLHTDYAFRILLYLASIRPDRASVGTIAERYGISRNHLTKVSQRLVNAGFVHSSRGKGGGIALARAPEAISLGAVVRVTEEGFPIAECFPGGSGGCRIAPCCELAGVLKQALDAFLAVLDRHTLADILHQPQSLRRLLQIETL